jgi:hypothetical protein
MSEIVYDERYSTVEVSTDLGINFSSDNPRLKHTGTGTFTLQGNGEISIDTTDTTNGIKIGETANVPVSIGSGGGNVTFGNLLHKSQSFLSTSDELLSSSDGNIVYIALDSGNVNLTLPTPTAGTWFKFIITAVDNSDTCTITTHDGSNIIHLYSNINSTISSQQNRDTITFTTSAVANDFVELTADGTNWRGQSISSATSGITYSAT